MRTFIFFDFAALDTLNIACIVRTHTRKEYSLHRLALHYCSRVLCPRLLHLDSGKEMLTSSPRRYQVPLYWRPETGPFQLNTTATSHASGRRMSTQAGDATGVLSCPCQSEARALAIGWHVLALSFLCNNQGQGRHKALAALGDDIIGLVLLLPGANKQLTWPEGVYIS